MTKIKPADKKIFRIRKGSYRVTLNIGKDQHHTVVTANSDEEAEEKALREYNKKRRT